MQNNKFIWDEIRKYDFTKIPYPSKGSPTPVEVVIVENK